MDPNVIVIQPHVGCLRKKHSISSEMMKIISLLNKQLSTWSYDNYYNAIIQLKTLFYHHLKCAPYIVNIAAVRKSVEMKREKNR